jgi:predicted nuclease of predicted toxin-antitoxin system
MRRFSPPSDALSRRRERLAPRDRAAASRRVRGDIGCRDAIGAPDKIVLDAANAEGCILITEDRDFGELVIRQHHLVRGMILLELDRLSNVAEADAAFELVSTHADKLFGNLVVVEPGRIRIRPLPR